MHWVSLHLMMKAMSMTLCVAVNVMVAMMVVRTECMQMIKQRTSLMLENLYCGTRYATALLATFYYAQIRMEFRRG